MSIYTLNGTKYPDFDGEVSCFRERLQFCGHIRFSQLGLSVKPYSISGGWTCNPNPRKYTVI